MSEQTMPPQAVPSLMAQATKMAMEAQYLLSIWRRGAGIDVTPELVLEFLNYDHIAINGMSVAELREFLYRPTGPTAQLMEIRIRQYVPGFLRPRTTDTGSVIETEPFHLGRARFKLQPFRDDQDSIIIYISYESDRTDIGHNWTTFGLVRVDSPNTTSFSHVPDDVNVRDLLAEVSKRIYVFDDSKAHA